MERETDIVESLIRSAGRRVEPPEEAYRQVFAAATAALRSRMARRRRRFRGLWAGAAAAAVLAAALIFPWAQQAGEGGELARVVRVIGSVEQADGDDWRALDEGRGSLGTGARVRTRAGGRAALALAGGVSLRMAAGTEVTLDAPARLSVSGGTVYVDSGAIPGAARLEIVTPAGTARDIGTQFELQVAGTALRLRVREGTVSIDRGGQLLTGVAGEQIAIDVLCSVVRDGIAPDADAWQWAESVVPTPDMDGRSASELIAWVARETGRRLHYATPQVEQRAAQVILHGNIRNLSPLEALDAMLATTDLEYAVDGHTMEIRTRRPGTH
jgi:ferric-dicitrate binding protein FerR (iron transport regulator)